MNKLICLFFMLLYSSVLFSETDAEYDPDYIGVSFITPGGINFIGGLATKSTTLKFAVGYLDENTNGIEFGATVARWSGRSSLRSVQIIIGDSNTEDPYTSEPHEWRYAGISATYRFDDFIIEPGITAGEGDFSSPQLSLQLGFLWDM